MSAATVLRPGVDLSVLTADQMKALEQMRDLFKNETYPDQEDPASWFQLEDWTFLRYLRARDYLVSAAEEMLKATLEMRRKYKPHLLSENEPALRDMINLGVWFLLPPSQQHDAVQLTEVGKLDVDKVVSEEDYTRYLILCNELACRQLARDGWKSHYILSIFDLRCFSVMRLFNAKGSKLTKMMIAICESNYPEMLGKAIMFNMPLVFRASYKLVKPWLAEATSSKIVFATDADVLDLLLTKESRMERHGGTRVKEYPSLHFEE